VFYSEPVEQTTLLDPSITEPMIVDLAGVLCAQGQIVRSGHSSARLSVVVADEWRARAIADECSRRGLAAEIARSGSGQWLVRTTFEEQLLPLANLWHRGAVKAVPSDFRLTGAMLRSWALVGGQPTELGYLLALDRRAPDTHSALSEVLRTIGLNGTRMGPRGGGPALRVSGKRRLAILAQLLGEFPVNTEFAWPGEPSIRRAS
jgi:hypothetical protein